MSALQEAYILLQQQPESNIRVIVDVLRKMSSKSQLVNTHTTKRTGIGNNKYNFLSDFDATFDALDNDIAADFYGEL